MVGEADSKGKIMKRERENRSDRRGQIREGLASFGDEILTNQGAH